jgi:hypothetical protein
MSGKISSKVWGNLRRVLLAAANLIQQGGGMEILKKSVDSFFESKDRVLVVKGAWGVGKTYFWDTYIAERMDKNDLSQIAYSYISLFGKTTLDDVRTSIFHRAKPISSSEVVEEAFKKEFSQSSVLFQKTPWLASGLGTTQRTLLLLGRWGGLLRQVPFLNPYSSMLGTLEYALVKNYIVCFDDLERKGDGLSVKEIMGLVDELAQRKACKVVLIFNENSLPNEADVKEYESYREKVVDVELTHNPSCADNLRCVLSESHETFNSLCRLVSTLNIRNIRILLKLTRLVEKISPYLDSRLIEEFLSHAVILCWSYYGRSEALPFDLVKDNLERSSWLSLGIGKADQESDNDKLYREIATTLELQASGLDKFIIQYMQHGYADVDELKCFVAEWSSQKDVDEVGGKLQSAWSLYRNSFEDNLADFLAQIKDVLDNDMKKLQLADFSSAINTLEQYGEGVDAYIEKYVCMHSDSLKSIDLRHPWGVRGVENKILKAKIDVLFKESAVLNLDDVAYKLATQNGWNPDDIEFLCSLSVDDYYRWMKSNPANILLKIRGGLLTFRRLQSSGDEQSKKYEKITENVTSALKKIASENLFNRNRVKFMYEIDMGE